jgi:sugar-specific transcriptional regulator TrmB
MIVNDEFLNKLRRSFNLNLYEVKLWTALLSRGVSTAGELSDIADVPRSRTYDVLESLERKGFIIVKPKKRIKDMAIEPKKVIIRVQGRIERNAKESVDRLDRLSESDVLKELNVLYNQGIEPMQTTDFSGALKGRHNLYDQLASLIKDAETNISLLTTQDGVVRKIRTLKPLLEKAKAKGVDIRIAAPINEKTREMLKNISDIAEIREISDISGRFCIVDDKQLLFMLMDDNDVHPTYDMGLWVNTPFFAKTMNKMFEKVWQEGKTYSPEESSEKEAEEKTEE